MRGLTNRQKELYEFIIKYQTEKSIIPSLPVMAAQLKVSIPRIQHIISALTRKKFIYRENIYKISALPETSVPLAKVEPSKQPDEGSDMPLL